LLQDFWVKLLGINRHPFVAAFFGTEEINSFVTVEEAFFGTEEINSFVTVEELKDFVWRK
jgi:hypothetical protein